MDSATQHLHIKQKAFFFNKKHAVKAGYNGGKTSEGKFFLWLQPQGEPGIDCWETFLLAGGLQQWSLCTFFFYCTLSLKTACVWFIEATSGCQVFQLVSNWARRHCYWGHGATSIYSGVWKSEEEEKVSTGPEKLLNSAPYMVRIVSMQLFRLLCILILSLSLQTSEAAFSSSAKQNVQPN